MRRHEAVARLIGRVPPAAWRVLEFAALALVLVAGRMYAVANWKLPAGDVTEYHHYALAFWTQHPLLRSLPVEYPPLSILVFTTTVLPPLPDFQSVFSWWMGAAVLLGYAGFLRFSTRRKGLIYIFYLIVGADAVLLARYDIVPALVTLAALWACERRRFTWAYALLAIGTLLKLYPIFLLPVVIIAHWHTVEADVPGASWAQLLTQPLAVLRTFVRAPALRPIARGTLLCLGLVVVIFGGAIALSGVDALSGFAYAGNRPLQIESTPASLLWLGTLFGFPAHADFSFISLNLAGELDRFLKPLSAVALVASCLLVYWRQLRGKLTVGQAFLACLAAVIVTNKIFSPQYLIWILPIVAAVDGFSVLWTLIAALTTLIFPILYGLRAPIWTVPFTPEFLPAIALRNGLLLVATVRAILGARRHGAAATGGKTTTPPEEAEPAGTEPMLAR